MTVRAWPFGTTSTRSLPSRSRRVPGASSPFLSSSSAHCSSADANTLAGAPASICFASVEDDANVICIGACPAFCQAGSRSFITSVKLAAANTTSGASAALAGRTAAANGNISADRRDTLMAGSVMFARP